MADEITVEDIVDLALAPASMTVDGMTVSERSADDVLKLIAEAARLRAITAGTSRRSAWSGIATRAVPGGGGPT